MLTMDEKWFYLNGEPLFYLPYCDEELRDQLKKMVDIQTKSGIIESERGDTK